MMKIYQRLIPMTVKVLGHWEIGWDTPWQEYSWWRHPLKEFGVDEFYMIPRTGIQRPGVIEFDHIDEVYNSFPEFTVVFVDESAEDELQDFVHPDDALYVIGKTSYSPYVNREKIQNYKCVKIPSVINQGGFWGNQAISIILYDRFLKEMKK
jgi:hypothetical protein